MKGLWDDTNCVLALGFAAGSRGNMRVNRNTGEMAGYPSGAYDATFTNMGSGYGFVFGSAGAGHCNFDGINDYIHVDIPLSLSNTSKFFYEVKITANLSNIFSVVFNSRNVSGTQNVRGLIRDTGAFQMSFYKQGATSRSVVSNSGEIVNGQDYTLGYMKDGASLKLYKNGAEIGSYSTQDNYDQGDAIHTYNKIGNYATSDNVCDMFWWSQYSDAISDGRISVNHNLDKTMTLFGFDDGAGNMKLVTGVPLRRQQYGQRFGQLAGQN